MNGSQLIERITPEFKTWLSKPENTEQFQGLTKEQYSDVYANALQMHEVYERLGMTRATKAESFPEGDDFNARLERDLKEKTILELNGLFWVDRAIEDALNEFGG